MNKERTIGSLLIAGAIGVFIPYTILTMTFEYPDILRQDTGTILTKFHNGGSSLVLTWWAFAILGLPLLVAYILIGQWLGLFINIFFYFFIYRLFLCPHFPYFIHLFINPHHNSCFYIHAAFFIFLLPYVNDYLIDFKT